MIGEMIMEISEPKEISEANEISDTKIFGFWVYLMTDLVIFAALFACFIVLRGNTFGGPSAKELFYLPSVLAETLILLTSSFTCSLGMISVHQRQKGWAILWFAFTFILGVAFLFIEISEFIDFVSKGASWQRSAFLSSFFTLVGTHGFHISIGLLWMAVMMVRIALKPLVEHSVSRIFRMVLFWHFLDFVWIFIFTVVYGIGYLL
jgi:cytochrome o ubiquinol oxidase subunit 3